MVVDWWYGSFALIEQLVCCATLLLLYRRSVSEAELESNISSAEDSASSRLECVFDLALVLGLTGELGTGRGSSLSL
jgi:hypothetical protein